MACRVSRSQPVNKSVMELQDFPIAKFLNKGKPEQFAARVSFQISKQHKCIVKSSKVSKVVDSKVTPGHMNMMRTGAWELNYSRCFRSAKQLSSYPSISWVLPLYLFSPPMNFFLSAFLYILLPYSSTPLFLSPITVCFSACPPTLSWRAWQVNAAGPTLWLRCRCGARWLTPALLPRNGALCWFAQRKLWVWRKQQQKT